MKAAQISKVLHAMGIANFLDSCNPDFTVHITETGVLIDALREDGPWDIVPVDRSDRNAEWPRFNSEAELVALFQHE